MQKIFIFSAGPGSREVLRLIQDMNEKDPVWEILGFVDNSPALIGNKVDGYPVYDPEHLVPSEDVYGICGIMDPALRKKIVETEIEAKGFRLASAIHPTVARPKDFVVGPGAIIYPGVNISFNVKLGRCVSALYNVLLGHHVNIGHYSAIMPSAAINSNCIVEDSCIIGSGAVLNPGVTVGKGTIIGVGTTLFGDVGEKKSVVDLPRKIIKDR